MKTILATTDFTQESRAAVNYAARLALINKCELQILHATYIPVISDAFIDVTVTLEEVEKSDKEKMADLVRHIQSKQGPALRIKGINEVGLTEELLKEKITQPEDTLVVIGVKHVEKFSRAVFGSTATSLAGQIPCPLMIIPPEARFRPWKKLAFAFDNKEIPVKSGIRFIKEMAGRYGSKLHFVHVMSIEEETKDSTPISAIRDIIGGESHVHFLEGKDDTVATVRDWIRRYKANVVVMVARKHNIFWRMFNESHTKEMAFESSVPVLVLPEN